MHPKNKVSKVSEKSRLELAEIVKALRKHKGWSEQELATRAGIGRSSLRDIESGQGNPTLSTLDKLGTALGVELY